MDTGGGSAEILIYGAAKPWLRTEVDQALRQRPDIIVLGGYTPDTAYFTLDGLFRQGLVKVASELTLNHLAHYNWSEEWQIPVAPEAYRRDLTLFGDQYSNFNAGKILLYLEGLGGLKVSLPDQQLTIRSALPDAWEWMEIRLPVAEHWTKIRYTHDGVEVSDSPLSVFREDVVQQ